MKFKFRVDPQDLMIFVMFAMFLLFIVAFFVVNIYTFANQFEKICI